MNGSFWDFKSYSENRWFKFLISLYLLITITYVFLHITEGRFWAKDEKLGYEYAVLSDEQKLLVTQIYIDSVEAVEDVQDTVERDDTTANPTLNKTAATQKISNGKKLNWSSNIVGCGSFSSKDDQAIMLINSEFNNKIDATQLDSIRKYLTCASNTQAISFLNSARFQVKSYFWLIGPAVYFEIIFWSWFGVLSSIVFSLGVVGRNNPSSMLVGFNSSEIPYQIAKLFYAPACTLAIVLGYNYFKDTNLADISSGKGVIVFAFIGGFYSSRVVAFLERLKEVILPHDPNNSVSGNSTTANSTNSNGQAGDDGSYDPVKDPPPPAPTDDLSQTEVNTTQQRQE